MFPAPGASTIRLAETTLLNDKAGVPLAAVRFSDVPLATPRVGVVSVGDVDNTTPPVPVDADVDPVPLRALAM